MAAKVVEWIMLSIILEIMEFRHNHSILIQEKFSNVESIKVITKFQGFKLHLIVIIYLILFIKDQYLLQLMHQLGLCIRKVYLIYVGIMLIMEVLLLELHNLIGN